MQVEIIKCPVANANYYAESIIGKINDIFANVNNEIDRLKSASELKIDGPLAPFQPYNINNSTEIFEKLKTQYGINTSAMLMEASSLNKLDEEIYKLNEVIAKNNQKQTAIIIRFIKNNCKITETKWTRGRSKSVTVDWYSRLESALISLYLVPRNQYSDLTYKIEMYVKEMNEKTHQEAIKKLEREREQQRQLQIVDILNRNKIVIQSTFTEQLDKLAITNKYLWIRHLLLHNKEPLNQRMTKILERFDTPITPLDFEIVDIIGEMPENISASNPSIGKLLSACEKASKDNSIPYQLDQDYKALLLLNNVQ